MSERERSVRAFGACGDGVTDDFVAFMRAIGDGGQTVRIPTGVYLIGQTLLIPDDTTLLADTGARILFDGERHKSAGEFLLSNADPEHGNRHITICGGIWDGNNQGKGNRKPPITQLSGYSGVVLNFFNVRELTLDGIEVADSVTYNIRLSRVDGFVLNNISFSSVVPGWNQDGIHCAGEVRNGIVRHIRAITPGQTNDDLIALNADDCLTRVENVGTVCGVIENLLIEDVYAENCHTLLRLLSVDSPIRHVTVRNLQGGFRCFAINADGARYCATPLFSDGERPMGIGRIENVSICGISCYPVGSMNPAVCLETQARNFTISDFSCPVGACPALQARHLPGALLHVDQLCQRLNATDVLTLAKFENLILTSGE